MAAFSASPSAAAGHQAKTGLRPEPQGVGTSAARAAHQKFGAEPESRAPCGKGVFDRHSTQSLIAAELRCESPKLKELAVDGGVYEDARSVDESLVAHAQAPVYTALSEYTARTLTEFGRV